MKRLMGILLLGLVIIGLNGCAAALIGGSAVGGYMVGKDERGVGRIAEDGAITAKINAAYVQDELVETLKINVDTYRGVVTLTGKVPNRKMIDRAIELAQDTGGVEEINSLLTVEGEENTTE